MKRREFVALVGGAAAWPFAALAQNPRKMPIVGILAFGVPPTSRNPNFQSLLQGLRDLGWIEGQNIVIEFRWAVTIDLMPEKAAELVAMNVDVIFAASATHVEAARQATRSIPIVFASHGDPVGVGHVTSLAQPGGNITGVSMLFTELVAKRLEILKEAVVGATRIGVLWNPTTPTHPRALNSINAAAEKLGVNVQFVPARTADELDAAISTMTQTNAEAFLEVPSPLTGQQQARLAESVLKHKLPGMFGYKGSAEAGGLMFYGANHNDAYRRSAVYVDKILKGDKPADLSIEQASRYELVINLKTAKVLGLSVPAALIARSDAVIE